MISLQLAWYCCHLCVSAKQALCFCQMLHCIQRICFVLQISAELEQPGAMFDIMAQQLKFIACLKVAMEELATLATGFEVEGGQLRYQLYIWLEKQTEVLEVNGVN